MGKPLGWRKVSASDRAVAIAWRAGYPVIDDGRSSGIDRSRSPYASQGAFPSRPGSTNQLNHLSGFQTQGPTNEAITLAIRECLGEVDLDNVTKKQLKALAEQKLQCQLPPEKRAFLDSQIDFELANM